MHVTGLNPVHGYDMHVRVTGRHRRIHVRVRGRHRIISDVSLKRLVRKFTVGKLVYGWENKHPERRLRRCHCAREYPNRALGSHR